MADRLRYRVAALIGGLALAMEGDLQAQMRDGFELKRKSMVEEIAAIARMAGMDTGRPVLAAPVMAAMAKVPRHEFVTAANRRNAYANRPLSIGAGQTISQPYIVALMSDLMQIKAGDKVLEVGTGSGYQAAVLAEMGAVVHTIEIIDSLAQEARARLIRLGYGKVYTRVGDGYQGWPEQAPFDAIMLTAAARDVPQPLIDQLKPGGRLIVPVGEQEGVQSLLLIEKRADGTVARRNVLAVRFVPLTDKSGIQR